MGYGENFKLIVTFEGLLFGATKNTEGVGLFDAYLVWMVRKDSIWSRKSDV